jgi:hypothetical protein
MWNVFEQPWTLLVTAAVLLLLVACIRPFVNEKYKRRLWLIPILVAVMGPMLDLAVYTDREKIEDVIDTGVTALENEDCDAIASIISPNYKDSMHYNKETLISECRLYLQPPAIDKVIDSILDMNIAGNTATVTVLDRIFFDEENKLFSPIRLVLVKARIELEKGSEGNWLVSRTEILAVNNQPSQWEKVDYGNW